MAALSNFAITIQLSGSVTNPINSTSFQAITPWGKSGVCATVQEAISQVFEGKAGNQWSGRMGAYFSAQTLYGASGSGPTGYTAATEVGG